MRNKATQNLIANLAVKSQQMKAVSLNGYCSMDIKQWILQWILSRITQSITLPKDNSNYVFNLYRTNILQISNWQDLERFQIL